MDITDFRRLRADYYTYTFPFPFTVAGQTLEVTKNIVQIGKGFELFAISHTHANAFTFRIKDSGNDRYLMNQHVPSACCSGSGPQPYILPVSYLFDANRAITIDAVNGAVAANSGSMTLIGATLREDADAGTPVDYSDRAELIRENLMGMFYAYGVTITFTAGAGQVITRALQMLNTGPFEQFHLQRSHAAGFDLMITDESSGLKLFNEPAPSASICGNANNPGIMPVTRIYPANGSLTISATNTNAGAHTGQIVLAGAQLVKV